MILIAGAGLAGLSAAFHLKDREHRVIEKESRPGGLCRTEQRGNYSFDYGGHLLHIRDDYTIGLAKDLLGDRLKKFKRRSSVLSHNILTPYPFQANTHGLPPPVIRDCVVGFVEAMIQREKGAPPPDNFRDWILYAFGRGFAENFFMPFNKKFFKRDLSELTDEWVSWSIPRPNLREVIAGAVGAQESEFGYNVEFYYPAGGIEELPRALAASIPSEVETGKALAKVIPSEHKAVLDNGEEVRYDRLITTVPLDLFLAMLRGAPDEISGAAQGLKILSVICENLGVKGPPLTDRHWVYVPEREFNFHRIGVYSNFMETPPEHSSLYLEITAPLGSLDDARIESEKQNAVAGLKKTPLWEDGGRVIELSEALLIERGYVVYDKFRRDNLDRVLSWLRSHDIEPVGRYARWEYSTMEDAILEGREAAMRCAGNG